MKYSICLATCVSHGVTDGLVTMVSPLSKRSNIALASSTCALRLEGNQSPAHLTISLDLLTAACTVKTSEKLFLKHFSDQRCFTMLFSSSSTNLPNKCSSMAPAATTIDAVELLAMQAQSSLQEVTANAVLSLVLLLESIMKMFASTVRLGHDFARDLHLQTILCTHKGKLSRQPREKASGSGRIAQCCLQPHFRILHRGPCHHDNVDAAVRHSNVLPALEQQVHAVDLRQLLREVLHGLSNLRGGDLSQLLQLSELRVHHLDHVFTCQGLRST
mmetsp:Transcript_39186/g.92243  ORF Transcript_39186/g.92243 Transcript_39186/m.92243 type:complete len:274 (+) Transcript_39186:680-1501(+)